MALPRPFALVHTADQWCRAAHEATALERRTGGVRLAGEPEADSPALEIPLPIPAGLAFDPWCRLFHGVPAEGRIERLLGGAGLGDPFQARDEQPEPLDVFELPDPSLGDFVAKLVGGPLAEPRGLAIDDDGRLFVAETGAARLLVYDLVDRRLLRHVPFPERPVDVATDGETVWVALAGSTDLARLSARGEPRRIALPAGVGPVDRLAVSPSSDSLFLLEDAGTPAARVVPFERPADAWAVPFATDLEFTEDGVLVVARRPGEDFLRFDPATGEPDDLPRLKARGYDGAGIVRTPAGAIGFWTVSGFRQAVAARIRYRTRGRVVTLRLDSGDYQTAWGRLFLDACLPADTDVRVFAITADEVDEDEPLLPRTPPESGCPGPFAGTSPPMPPARLAAVADADHRPLHRRAGGRELPWGPALDGALAAFETYEAPVFAPPGRFLWVSLVLTGKGRSTPRVKSLRVEKPGHELLRRLPKVYSRDGAAADFLRRALAPVDGEIGALEAKSFLRRALVDPRSAPAEVLPWLASFLGLVLDDRWPLVARRRLIEEAAWLFRFRGTVPGLERYLNLYLEAQKGAGIAARIVEHWRLRGLGGTIVGEAAGALSSQAVLGAGFRVGGAVGRPGEVALPGGEDGIALHAHRFTVVVPAALTAEDEAVLRHVLDVHRPAHTLYELCSADHGLRVGVGLYLGLSSTVGRGAGFRPLIVGGGRLGTDRFLGRPLPGIRPESSRAGFDARVG
jgi:phage tail-like protein